MKDAINYGTNKGCVRLKSNYNYLCTGNYNTTTIILDAIYSLWHSAWQS